MSTIERPDERQRLNERQVEMGRKSAYIGIKIATSEMEQQRWS